MKFDELKNLCEQEFHTVHLADIAHEFGVTPQVVSNWKARNKVPYKYVKLIRDKINQKSNNAERTIKFSSGQINNLSKIEESDVSIFEIVSLIINTVKNNLKFFFFFPISFVVPTALYVTYIVGPTYFSQAKIIITSKNSSGSGIGQLASEFGFNVGSGGGNDLSSIEIIPEIIKSRRLASSLLEQKFDSESFTKKQSLLNILSKKDLGILSPSDSMLQIKAATKSVKGMIDVDINKKTNIFIISCFAPEPKLVADLVTATVREIDNFQKEFKFNLIKEKRIFIEDRIRDIEIELNQSEEVLKTFRERNRDIDFSPGLLLEESRYMREKQVLLQMFITLKNQFELAQIDEVQNNSSLSYLDEPEIPNIRISPNRKVSVLIAFIFGLIFAFFYGISRLWLIDNWDDLRKKIKIN